MTSSSIKSTVFDLAISLLTSETGLEPSQYRCLKKILEYHDLSVINKYVRTASFTNENIIDENDEFLQQSICYICSDDADDLIKTRLEIFGHKKETK